MTEILMLGLQAQGKTTFLAALWHVLETGDVDGALKLVSFSADRSYLNAIRQRWIECEPTARTSRASREVIELTLTDGDKELNLSIPDLSGESYENYFADRAWPVRFDRLASSAKGLLLFLHPMKLVVGARIEDALQLDDALDGPDDAPGDAPSDAKSDEPTFDPDTAPSQVKLVDMIQLILDRSDVGHLPIAVIVSAWDTAKSVSPTTWLRRRTPLLYQYLNAAPELEFSVFGLSALGGSLPADKERLASLEQPSLRIELIRAGSPTTNDITLPLRWLVRGGKPE